MVGYIVYTNTRSRADMWCVLQHTLSSQCFFHCYSFHSFSLFPFRKFSIDDNIAVKLIIFCFRKCLREEIGDVVCPGICSTTNWCCCTRSRSQKKRMSILLDLFLFIVSFHFRISCIGIIGFIVIYKLFRPNRDTLCFRVCSVFGLVAMFRSDWLIA